MIKKTVAFSILICMLCVSISSAGISVSNPTTKTVNTVNEELVTNGVSVINPATKNVNTVNEELVTNKATESPEVNTLLLNNVNREVNKYLNMGNYIKGDPPKNTMKEVKFPWSNHQAAGNWVTWIIRVNFKDNQLSQEINIDPKDFKDRFLDHPWHYEVAYFDLGDDGNLKVYYSFFTSSILNSKTGRDEKSLEICLKADAANIMDRTAKLEIWSEIKLTWGLIKENSAGSSASSSSTSSSTSSSMSDSVSSSTSGFASSQANQMSGSYQKTVIKSMTGQTANTGFSPLPLRSPINNMLVNSQKVNVQSQPIPRASTADDDYISAGMGMCSVEGKNIPMYFEKTFAIAKESIFQPTIFEQELKQVTSAEPLGLLFGFQAYKSGSTSPSFDIAFEIDFDPAIYVRTQFTPLDGYVYYGWGSGSARSTETRITFSSNIIKGSGENTELTLIFDNTNPLAQSGNWMSFDITLRPIGFVYKANKKHTVGVLISSPSFSAKLKLVGIPTSITCDFKVDLSFTYQKGHLLDASGTGTLNLQMSSGLDSVILYYPELSSNEPKIEFVKVTSIPSSQSLSVYSHLYVHNDYMTTLMGEGYVDLTMSSNLGKIQVFYRKADPDDPDKLFIDVPYGIPASQRVGVAAQLYIDLDDFSNPNNYVFGRAYRTSSGNLQEIDGYLPGETEPIVKITEIPSNSEAEVKLEWNKLKGYAHAARFSTSNPDPIEVNIDIGTFNIYNFFQIRDGHIDLNFYLNENGYFGFDTANEMIANELKVTDTSTGNQLIINADKVSANDLWADWNLNLNQQPIQVEELSFGGSLSLLKDLSLSATYQGKNLAFTTDWQVGESGEFSFDFTQDEPVELLVDDLFPDNPMYDLGGGVIISDDFHFDIKWKWGERGYFKINEDTNDPNFDYIGFIFKYTPEGSSTPQYGIDVGGTNVGVIVYMEWWKHPSQWIPQVWWYVYIMGNFHLHLLWKGTWYYNV